MKLLNTHPINMGKGNAMRMAGLAAVMSAIPYNPNADIPAITVGAPAKGKPKPNKDRSKVKAARKQRRRQK